MQSPDAKESGIERRDLEELAQRFECEVDALERLCQECETFREISLDYLECSQTLKRFEQLGDEAEARVLEYRDMQAHLEDELRTRLEDQDPCRRRGRTNEGD